MPEPIFQVEHLRLTYPARRGQPPATILDDVSVEVARGGALVLVGPSGSGKSSLLRCLNSLGLPRRHPSMTILDLSWWQPGLALLLVVVVTVISLRQRLGLERDLLVGTVRTIAQLYLVGLILAAVFSAARWYWVLLIIIVMAAIATHAAVARLAKPIPGVFWIAAGALTISTAATLAYVIGVVVRPTPWWEPQYVIPIAGMILGNSMTSAALAGDRLQADLFTRRDEIEARLALGFSGREAVQPLVRSALRAAMIPTVNGMMTVGVVQLPGMMTGQILAGASPLTAIRYQIVVVFMLSVATAPGSLLFVRLAVGRYLTPAHQLRRYLL